MRKMIPAILAVAVAAFAAAPAAANEGAPKIALDPIGHWHVYHAKTLTFKVTEADGSPMANAKPVVEITRAGSDRVSTMAAADGKVMNKGGGAYAVEYTPGNIGSYAVAIKVAHGHDLAVTAPVVFEVARDGDEGVKVSAGGKDYVYQIRYNWDPGHIHANDSKPVKLVFELMRGIPTGSQINWEKPWTNKFDHVSGANEVTVTLASKDGDVSEKIQCAYKGRGIYEASRVFKPGEVGHEKHYEVKVAFKDPQNDALVTSPRAYGLRAVASH